MMTLFNRVGRLVAESGLRSKTRISCCGNWLLAFEANGVPSKQAKVRSFTKDGMEKEIFQREIEKLSSEIEKLSSEIEKLNSEIKILKSDGSRGIRDEIPYRYGETSSSFANQLRELQRMEYNAKLRFLIGTAAVWVAIIYCLKF